MHGAVAEADLIVDALIGYSLQGDPRGDSRDLIDWANSAEAPVLSLDTPRGLNVITGMAATPCLQRVSR